MDRYAPYFLDPQGAGDARPSALQIVRDEGATGKLEDKVIVIAGATSGLGLETARALSATSASLILLTRNLKTGSDKLADMLVPGRVSLVELNLDSFSSVRAGAKQILSATKGQVNVLINSAGVMGISEHTLTEDGIETHFSSNYLGFFLLFNCLKQALLASQSPDFHSRVVVVSSSSHRAGALPASGNYNFEKGGYSHEKAYNNSKLAAIYLANHIERLYGERGLHATSLHPGAVATNISRNLPPESLDAIMTNPLILKMMKSPSQGAATTVWAAIGKEWEGRGGKYLEDCMEARLGEDDEQVFGTGYVERTYDAKEEARLWEDSLKLVGLGSTGEPV